MSAYYNPETKEKLVREQLMALLNTSIPEGEEEVFGWRLVHDGVAPDIYYGQRIVPGGIELIDGNYVQTYDVAGNPAPVPQDPADRLTDIEDMLSSLRDTQQDLVELNESGTTVSARLAEIEDAIVELASIITEG